MTGFNVREYGDTRWHRLADRLDWIVDSLVIPAFFIVLLGAFILAVIVLLALALFGLVTA